MPALEAAENALKVLEKKDLDLLKSMRNPPLPIKITMQVYIKKIIKLLKKNFFLQALCLILDPNPKEKKKNPDTLKIETDWWAASIRILNNPKLLDVLISFDRDNVEEKLVLNLGKFLKDPEQEKNLDIKVVENASTACKCIIMWINGVYNFYFVNKRVKPKKASLAEA